MRLQRLFEPAKIGTMTVRNRIVMPAMDTNLGSRDGFVTPRMLDYYDERARGGAGLIIVECTSIDYPRGKVTMGQISIGDDKYLEGLRLFREKDYQRAIDLWQTVLDKYPGSKETRANIEQARLRMQQ